MARLCAALGDPERKLPPVIHVAGTNGKGSTVAFLRAMAEAAGLKVHAYTSPHLVRFAERIRLAGTLISDDQADRRPRPGRGGQRRPADHLLRDHHRRGLPGLQRDAGRPVPARGGPGRGAGRHQCRRAASPSRVIAPGGHRPPRVPRRHPRGRSPRRRPASCKRRRSGRDRPPVRGRLRRHRAPRGRGRRAADRDGPRLRRLGRARRRDLQHRGRRQERLLDLPAPGLVGPHQIDNAGLAVAAMLALDDLRMDAAPSPAGVGRRGWPARMQRLAAGRYADAGRSRGARSCGWTAGTIRTPPGRWPKRWPAHGRATAGRWC